MGSERLELVAMIVDDYDRAIAFFTRGLGFQLIEDSASLTNDGRRKRWVVVRPPNAECGLLLARADGETQERAVGNQMAGRVGFFLRVDDFEATVSRVCEAGATLVTTPRHEPYGQVVVFQDIFGNKWDLLGPRPSEPLREKPLIIGRSSSSYTRVARVVAAELGIDCELHVVRDLTSLETNDYGGNPALKIPSLRTEAGTWFGALNAARALARGRGHRIVWPESVEDPMCTNAQELVWQAMSTEVALIMAKVTGAGDTAGTAKQRKSLLDSLAWLDAHVDEAIGRLPARDFSLFEVTLYCLVTHLEFREVATTSGYGKLTAFCQRFGERSSAKSTPYRFDS